MGILKIDSYKLINYLILESKEYFSNLYNLLNLVEII